MSRPFGEILGAHLARYPLMEPQDCIKLCYQSEYGPEHIISDAAKVQELIGEEWADAAPEPREEDIGGGLCRFHLGGGYTAEKGRLLARLLCMTAREHRGSSAGLDEKLALLEGLDIEGMEGRLGAYRLEGCPPVHHSRAFREAYRPRYRLLKAEYARYFPALVKAAALAEGGGPVLVAIDGRCGSGKSGLAGLIAELFPCNLLHTDDFYLPMKRRRPDWRELPGGNMDFSRLREEALLPLLGGKAIQYRAYDCQSGRMKEAVAMEPRPIVLLEGSYSHHPGLGMEYGLKLFLTCPEGERAERLKRREVDYYPAFESTWIPMEELYIDAFAIGKDAMAIDTGGLF